MKDSISVDIRVLTAIIGLFSFYCVLRAAVCIYLLSDMDISPQGLKYLSAETISVFKHTYYGLVFSIAAFSLVGVVSGASAYGIFNHKNWGKKAWMILSILLFIYFILASWTNSSSFQSYIPGIILCIFSWYVLWYLPRKNMQVDSLSEGNNDN